jgi:hypothetical protein
MLFLDQDRVSPCALQPLFDGSAVTLFPSQGEGSGMELIQKPWGTSIIPLLNLRLSIKNASCSHDLTCIQYKRPQGTAPADESCSVKPKTGAPRRSLPRGRTVEIRESVNLLNDHVAL